MAAMLTENALRILQKRYLDGESVDSMWDRVSGGNKAYRKLLSDLLFLPNSPTLFNAGRNNGCTLSACFVFDIGDYMLDHEGVVRNDSIVRTREKAILVAKAGGGVGYYLGNLRKKHSPIHSIHRKACGPVAVLRDLHGVSHLITQGGKRELAQMAVHPCWHEDIKDFIHCKDEDPQGLGSFNISVSWTDKWLKRALEYRTGDTVTPESEIWNEQCRSAWSHGCPGMLFHDTVNRANHNKHLGIINATNPCGETPNRSDEPCSLGSLALPRFFNPANRDINWNLLEEAAYTASWFLDDILDRNVFPHPDITKASLLTRKLGLGVMGWADLLAMMHIDYDSDKAVELADTVMSFIAQVSDQASKDMAKKKGPYPGYSDKTEAPCRRNETMTSVAPTGTISLIAGVYSSIEPYFTFDGDRTTAEGMKLSEGVPDIVHKYLDGFRPKTAGQISYQWHIKHQATFQKHTELGVSKTINLPNEATVQDVSDAYAMMYNLGCKGGTVFRDGCRDEQVLVDRTKTKSVYSRGVSLPARRQLPSERNGKTVKLRVNDVTIFLTTGNYEDGSLGEIFINGSFGSTMAGLLNAFCITFSVALQHGTPLADLVKHHKNTRFEPCGITDHREIPVCTSICDMIVRWLEFNYLKPQEAGKSTKTKKRSSGMLCPDCGAEAYYQAGCLTCPIEGCGWTRCG